MKYPKVWPFCYIFMKITAKFSGVRKFRNFKVLYSKTSCEGSNKFKFSLHGGKSKGTTCVVDRDVTAYLVVDRVLRFPTEQYGCRYGGYLGLNDVKVIF